MCVAQMKGSKGNRFSGSCRPWKCVWLWVRVQSEGIKSNVFKPNSFQVSRCVCVCMEGHETHAFLFSPQVYSFFYCAYISVQNLWIPYEHSKVTTAISGCDVQFFWFPWKLKRKSSLRWSTSWGVISLKFSVCQELLNANPLWFTHDILALF